MTIVVRSSPYLFDKLLFGLTKQIDFSADRVIFRHSEVEIEDIGEISLNLDSIGKVVDPSPFSRFLAKFESERAYELELPDGVDLDTEIIFCGFIRGHSLVSMSGVRHLIYLGRLRYLDDEPMG